MIFNIQALRGLAALLVVLVHLVAVLRPAGVPDSAAHFGEAGVDLFFVISGFVMVQTTIRKSVSALSFLKNRILRVGPLYWALTIVLYLVAVVAPRALGSLHPDASQLVRSLLFIPYQTHANPLVTPILFVGWTLDYEMAFYLIFASGMGLFRSRIPYVVWFSVAVLSILVSTRVFLTPASVAGQFYTDSIILEFGFGMLIGLAGGYLPRWASRWMSLPLAGAAFVCMMAFGVVNVALPRVLIAGVPSAVIVTAAVALEHQGRVLRNAMIELLGAASYALYLVHPFVITAVGRVGERFPGVSPTIAFTAIAFVLAIGTGLLLHLAVERPLNARLRRWTRSRRMITEQAETAALTELPHDRKSVD